VAATADAAGAVDAAAAEVAMAAVADAKAEA
jgi:hypothetical protein